MSELSRMEAIQIQYYLVFTMQYLHNEVTDVNEFTAWIMFNFTGLHGSTYICFTIQAYACIFPWFIYPKWQSNSEFINDKCIFYCPHWCGLKLIFKCHIRQNRTDAKLQCSLLVQPKALFKRLFCVVQMNTMKMHSKCTLTNAFVYKLRNKSGA